MKPIHIIVAMDENNAIGNKNRIMWDIPEDRAIFKKLTQGNIVIMGRKTWDSLPIQYKPLPKRTNIIVSKSIKESEGAFVAGSIAEAQRIAQSARGNVFCIGGANIYSQMIELSQYLHISRVKGAYGGDAYFPKLNFSEWKQIECVEYEKFTHLTYVRA